MKRHFFLLYWLLFIGSGATKSSAFFLRQYTTVEKLVGNTVYNSFLDSRGYMWFCTDRGLSRFDGTNFRNFTSADGMSDNEVFNVYEDKKGRIWLFTYNGEPSYYFEGKFYNASNDPFLKNLPTLPFICDMYEEDDALYIGYKNGEILKLKHNRISSLRKKTVASDRFWRFSKMGEYLVAVQEGRSYYYCRDTLRDIKITHTESAYTQKERTFFSENGNINITERGRIVWSGKDPEWTHNNIVDISSDDSGNIFVSTRNGLTIIDSTTGRKTQLLSRLGISSVRQDGYHNYWVTTLGQGIFYLNRNFPHVEVYPGDYKIVYSGHTLFIKKDDSLYALEDKNGLASLKPLASLSLPGITPLYLDFDKLIYTQYNTRKLNIYYQKEKITEQVKFEMDPHHVYPLSGDTFIVMDYSGISQVKLTVRNSRIVKSLPGNNKIHRSCQAEDGHVYYTTNAGKLCVYHPVENKSTPIDSFRHNNTVECLFVTGSWLVACDNRKQIHIYDLTTASKKLRLQTDDIIYDAEKIDQEQLLLKKQDGYVIAQVNHAPPFGISFSVLESPFQPQNMQELHLKGEHAIGKTGSWLFSFKKKLLYPPYHTPRLYVEQMEVNGVNHTEDSIRLKNTTECTIKIRLNAVSDNQRLRYAYRISENNGWGLWHTITGPELNILLLNAGSYRIEMKAISPNNRQSASRFITLEITPPFLRSAPFFLLLALLFVSGITLTIVFFIRRKKRAFQNELQHMQLEQKALNALMNPHFVFNVINNIQNLINSDAKESASNYLATMSNMIRQNMENLQFDLISLDNELKLISNYIQLQNLRFNDRITLKISHKVHDLNNIYLPPLLLHTFIENAVIHGIKTDQSPLLIAIDIQLTIDDYLCITVIDNGAGLNGEHTSSQSRKTSLGIDFNRKRLKRLSDFYKLDFQLEICNRRDGLTGTEAVIIFHAGLAGLMKQMS